ncbi:MAG: efflux RND transporter periplasmic adaptor subunit [Gammaproteobacteria bacterium]|nr:efflux RND transporter periplasmic adaptor subunit [Gammaproteobacteria bacterium]
MNRFNIRPWPRQAVVVCAFVLEISGAAGVAAQQAKGPPPAPVVVEQARAQQLAPVAWYPGTVISRNKTRLAAEVAGSVQWVAEVGANLAAGDVAARLDDTLLRQTLKENQAAVAREQARLTYLSAEVKRLEKLAKQNTATQSQLEEAVANLGVTRSELVASQARVSLTMERLERTVLYAPFAGVVVERLLEPGEWADEGSAVLRLVDSRTLDVQAWIPVQALRYVNENATLSITANPKKTTGTVRTLVPVGDDRSRLYEVRITVKDSGFSVGQDVRVAVPTAEPRQVVAVDRDALVLRRDGTVVYRVGEDDTADRVEVETGIASGNLIEVSGIKDGDLVVIRGGERLRPGQKLAVRKREGAN